MDIGYEEQKVIPESTIEVASNPDKCKSNIDNETTIRIDVENDEQDKNKACNRKFAEEDVSEEKDMKDEKEACSKKSDQHAEMNIGDNTEGMLFNCIKILIF